VSLLSLDGYLLGQDAMSAAHKQVFMVVATPFTVAAVVSDSVRRGGGTFSAVHCNEGSGGKIYRMVGSDYTVRNTSIPARLLSLFGFRK
jgi:hypothetical protein